MKGMPLAEFLEQAAASGDDHLSTVARLVDRFAQVAAEMRLAINEGALGAAFAATMESNNADGDEQKALDVHADHLFINAAREAGVAYYASEEQANPLIIREGSPVSVAIDPLDGSSNIDTNISIGTIFSVLPSLAGPDATFSQPGSAQLAAGFFVYGPQLTLALTLGQGTYLFVYSERRGVFLKAYDAVAIEPDAKEFAVNMSNYRHWDDTMRLYIDDCLSGMTGPREKDFNMRWIASLVAEAYRIMIRGGIFIYPRDGRKGYGQGRLRLVYEANPVAMLIEQAGGSAINGESRILDLKPATLHQRTPLIFGARREVTKISRYHSDPQNLAIRHPLFGNRGLFRS
jgi:fructose-1,6-bisphosphatase I